LPHLDLIRRFGWEPERIGGSSVGRFGQYFDDLPLGYLAGFLKDQRRVLLDTSGRWAPETEAHILLDLILPKLIAFDQGLVLHASVISGPCGALAFVAPSGCGKSTLSAALATGPFHLMGDDAAIVEWPDSSAEPICSSIYPSLRLLPDSLSQLFAQDVATAPVADYTTKRRIDLKNGPEKVPLKVIFQLAEHSEDIGVTAVSTAEACMNMISNAFSLDPNDVDETKRRFAFASEVARKVPMFRLRYPRDYSRLNDVRAAIVDTLERSGRSISAA
jgi:hypothetical protein